MLKHVEQSRQCCDVIGRLAGYVTDVLKLTAAHKLGFN